VFHSSEPRRFVGAHSPQTHIRRVISNRSQAKIVAVCTSSAGVLSIRGPSTDSPPSFMASILRPFLGCCGRRGGRGAAGDIRGGGADPHPRPRVGRRARAKSFLGARRATQCQSPVTRAEPHPCSGGRDVIVPGMNPARFFVKYCGLFRRIFRSAGRMSTIRGWSASALGGGRCFLPRRVERERANPYPVFGRECHKPPDFMISAGVYLVAP
jgi:hypothetical protein